MAYTWKVQAVEYKFEFSGGVYTSEEEAYSDMDTLVSDLESEGCTVIKSEVTEITDIDEEELEELGYENN